jgi:hypothetical protein
MAFTKPSLAGILDKAAKDNGWNPGQAQEAQLWYERFLQLCDEQGGQPVYVMHKKADLLWHTHILFTQQYTDYCNQVFGTYLHHTPLPPGAQPDPTKVAAGKKLYDDKHWPIPSPDSATNCH